MLVPIEVFDGYRVCDGESVRYALGGILFRREKDGSPVAVVTDHRRLIEYRWEETSDPTVANEQREGFEAIVPAEACKVFADYRKTIKGREHLPYVLVSEAESDSVEMRIIPKDGECERIVRAEKIEGRFPFYTPLLSESQQQQNVRIQFDARLLAELLRVLTVDSDGCDSNYVELLVPLEKEKTMCIVRKSEELRTTALIMQLSDRRADR